MTHIETINLMTCTQNYIKNLTMRNINILFSSSTMGFTSCTIIKMVAASLERTPKDMTGMNNLREPMTPLFCA